jgi:hypothetical protein
MRLKNNELIKFLVFNNVATKIFLETFFNLQVETIPFQLNNQPLDAPYFPNGKKVININANENEFFTVPI